jgi:hypothetical protein
MLKRVSLFVSGVLSSLSHKKLTSPMLCRPQFQVAWLL